MSRIAIWSAPMSGTINGVMKIARSLQMRGHDVCFVGMADCARYTEPNGFELVPVFETWFPPGYIDGWEVSMRDQSFLQSFRQQTAMIKEYRASFEHMIQGGWKEFKQVMDRVEPDLFLVEPSGGGAANWALLAHKCQVPSAYLCALLPITRDPGVPPLNTSLRPGGGRLNQLRIRWAWYRFLLVRSLQLKLSSLVGLGFDWVRYTRRLARVCDYPVSRLNTHTLVSPHLEIPELILCPGEFDYPQATGSDRWYVEAGIDLDRQESPFPWERINPQKKLVFCSLGTLLSKPGFLQKVIDAVAQERDWQLVINIGKGLKESNFSNLSPDTILVNSVPQLKLLEKADVMLTHGGINSVKECIFFGVPMVVFPFIFDQVGVAARVDYHRLGIVASTKRVTSEEIRKLLGRVLTEPAIRSSVESMSEVFRRTEEQRPSVDRIERIIRAQEAAQTSG